MSHDTNLMSNIFLFRNIQSTFSLIAIKYQSTFNPYASKMASGQDYQSPTNFVCLKVRGLIATIPGDDLVYV